LRLEDLNALSEDPDLWNDAAKAQALMKERTKLDGLIKEIDDLVTDLADNLELIEMGEAEGDDDIIKEAEAALIAARNRAGQGRVADPAVG